MKKKTAILTARLTPAEKAAIERRAKQANMTVTDYIVKSALGKNVRQTDELAPILSEPESPGAHLNQLTKLANMGRIDLVDAENFTEAYTNLYTLDRVLFTGRGSDRGHLYRHQKRKAEPRIDGGSHGLCRQR